MFKHLSQAHGYSLCPSLPFGPKTWPCWCLSGATSPDQGSWSQASEIWRGSARVRGTSREATTRLGNDAPPSHSSWAETRSPPKGTAWSRFARPALSLMHAKGVHHTLDSAMAHLAQSVLERLRRDESSSGFRDACGTVSHSLGRNRYYHVKTEHTRSTPALYGHFLGLTALSGNGPSPARQMSSTSVVFKEQRCMSALSSFCLAFSYSIKKTMLITKKVAVPQFWKEMLFCCWFQRASRLTYASMAPCANGKPRIKT